MTTTKLIKPHPQLLSLIGEWKGETRSWFIPDDPIEVSVTHGSITLFQDRFIKHDFKLTYKGEPDYGGAVYGYDAETGKFFSAVGINSYEIGTEIMLGIGHPAVANRFGVSRNGCETWGWRNELLLRSDDELVIRFYAIAPDESYEEMLAETVYTRVR